MAPMKSPSHQQTAHPYAGTYSLTHLAHMWGVSRKQVRELLRTGKVPFVEIDGQLRVPEEAAAQVYPAEKR